MKKYIGHIVLFFAVIIIVDFSFGKVCDYLYTQAKGGEAKQMNDLCLKDKYDVLVLGSSRAHHHYVSELIEDSLGMSCYNAGHDGNGIILMTGIWRMINNRYQPKLIIYDVEPAFDLNEYKEDGNNTRYLAVQKPYYDQPGIKQIFKDVSKEEYYKLYSGLCRYNSNLMQLVLAQVPSRAKENSGYVPLFGKMTKEPKKKENACPPIIDSLKLNYMRCFIRDISAQGIPLIIVVSPKYGAIDSYVFQPIKDICMEYNVPFLDYYSNQDFNTHKEWFKEPMHLNADGAIVFTSSIISKIKTYYANTFTM